MKIIIVGGGITGLSAAWNIQKVYPNASITLFEKQSHLGGFIQTSKESGFLFEKGPRTFSLSRSPHLLHLIQELNLETIFSQAQKRFILFKGKLRTPSSLLPRFFPQLVREIFVPPFHREDESIYDFAARRFGKRIAETFFDPLTLGIYAGDIQKLSIHSCFPSLCQWEKDYGSLVRAFFKLPKKDGRLFTLKGGMQTLVDALVKRLNIDFILNTEAEILNGYEVQTRSGIVSADRVLDATPFKVPKKSLWVVHFVYGGDVLRKKGFGYLVPSQEKEKILGAVFDSAIFPEQNRSDETRLTVMVREEHSPESAQEAIERHLGISARPIYQNAFFARDAIPQFEVGCGKIARISVDACIERGALIANSVEFFQKRA